jgi:fused signal recognition particle receptor
MFTPKRNQRQQSSETDDVNRRSGVFGRLADGLARTRNNLLGGIAGFFERDKSVDNDLIGEIETALLTADVGVDATERMIEGLSKTLDRRQLNDSHEVFSALRASMLEILKPVSKPLTIPVSHSKPFVVLMVGVNGTGKTTTIGKLANRFQSHGSSVMLAAGDTFRAAAIEQLQVWGQRNAIPVVAQHTGADSASVVFDALKSATARGVDVLIADTAGRLHTQANLMEELKKIRRVLGKLDPNAPQETMLVVDAGTGQNALVQAQQFAEAVSVTGITLTKLDGTAKGGIIFSIAQRLALPIRFIGVGEGMEDLREFNAVDFVDALLTH